MSDGAVSDLPGHRFQNFVAILERLFVDREGVSIASPQRLPDKDTGRLREHDVVITRTTHHGPTMTAIECRDHARKVGVPEIEGFAKKCEKTGIHRGIVVAANGFTQTARVKAKALNLTCMELAEAERFAWIGAVTVISRYYNFRKIELFARTSGNVVHPFALFDGQGRPYTGQGAQDFILEEIPRETLEAASKAPLAGQVIAHVKDFFVIDASGQRFEVQDITLSFELKVEASSKPITLHNYAGEEAAMEIASGQFSFTGGQATLAFVKTADGIEGHIFSKGVSSHRVCIGDPDKGGRWRGSDPADRNPLRG